MVWTLSESIFCWPRARFVLFPRERLPAALWVALVAFVALSEFADGVAVDLWCLRCLGFAIVLLLAEPSVVELCWPARAAGTQTHTSINAQTALIRALRISIQTLAIDLKPSLWQTFTGAKLPLAIRSPTAGWQCYHPRSEVAVPASVGLVYVTEVYRRRRWCHPAATNHADVPGRPHPGRSSCSTRSGQTLLHCSPAACSLPE
jgi:hypothetical protein